MSGLVPAPSTGSAIDPIGGGVGEKELSRGGPIRPGMTKLCRLRTDADRRRVR